MRLALVCSLVAVLLAGCDGSEGSAPAPAQPEPSPASSFPRPSQVPPVTSATLGDFSQETVVLPSGAVYQPGRERFGFAIFEVDGSPVDDADVAVYMTAREGGRTRGPFPARIEPLEVAAPYQSMTSSNDPDAPSVVYVADVRIPSAGEWDPVAMIRDGAGFTAVRMPTIEAEDRDVPDVGDPAPRVSTPTAEDVGAITEIETRSPPDTMHEEDLADVLGRKPVVLLFATPALCTSRVCAPVVDVAEQVHATRGGGVAFIHMEIWKDNDPNAPVREQVRAYGLKTEPWLFVIDEEGMIDTRIEGAYGLGELERAVERVVRGEGAAGSG